MNSKNILIAGGQIPYQFYQPDAVFGGIAVLASQVFIHHVMYFRVVIVSG